MEDKKKDGKFKYEKPKLVDILQTGAEGDSCADGTGNDACDAGVSAFYSCINGDGPLGG